MTHHAGQDENQSPHPSQHQYLRRHASHRVMRAGLLGAAALIALVAATVSSGAAATAQVRQPPQLRGMVLPGQTSAMNAGAAQGAALDAAQNAAQAAAAANALEAQNANAIASAAPAPATAQALTPLTAKQQATAAAATVKALAAKKTDTTPAPTPSLAAPGSVPMPPNVQVTAASIDKIFKTRRTLFLPFGQRMTVWEAPVGMCFLDESQYLEGQLIKQMRGGADKQGHMGPLLVAAFADCLELAKLEALPQIQASGPNYGDDDNNEALLLHMGTITWMTPKAPALETSLASYLDDKEPTYTRDVRVRFDKNSKQVGAGRHDTSLGGNMYSRAFMASPDQMHFDSRAHRTDTSVSVAFDSQMEAEYKKYNTVGVVGTSLIRGMPVEVSLGSTAVKKADKTTRQLTETLDRFFAQNVTLNN